jgi:hypothetical protein
MKKVLFVLMMLPLTVAAWAPASPASAPNPPFENCMYKGIKLWGKVKFVDACADITVKIVDALPDYEVKIVEYTPDQCGQWQIVDACADITVKIVDACADISVRYVKYTPY